ncbi:MAG: HDOD domain-containing protein [Lachnospiraceae bacterium]|nr:HDOD domain-containing protein [Lachnospiraceae bacterium]
MLATLIPLFDGNMKVCAYSIFTLRENTFLVPTAEGIGRLDGAAQIPGLEIVNSVGAGTLADDQEIFVEINNINVFTDISAVCEPPHEKIVLLLDSSITPDESYVSRLNDLKIEGYKLAMRKLEIKQFEAYREILRLMDYILLDHHKINISQAKIYFGKLFPKIKLCAVNVNSQEDYDKLTEDGGYNLYEGEFFRMPVVESDKEVAPLKATYIELLNVVNGPDFDLTDAADVIGHDTALVLSLLEMVNHMTRNSEITSVRHAAAMLGQKELKRWINTAVTKELCADKPSEITRLSLVRAKFAENLAPLYEMAGLSSELFLMGLFSILDIMLDKPMEEALKSVQVSKNIEDALIHNKGELAPILNFVKEYEDASWHEVSRLLVLKEIEIEPVYQAYVEALRWYRDLLSV